MRSHTGRPVDGEARYATRIDALDRAIESLDLNGIKRLVTKDPDLVRSDPLGSRLWLQRTADEDFAQAAPFLIGRGVHIERSRNYHTALSRAVTFGALDFVSAFLDAGLETDLFMSAGIGELVRVKGYFDSGTLSEESSSTGRTRVDENREVLRKPPLGPGERVSDALYVAARTGFDEVVLYLNGQGGDLDFRTECGGSALYWAVKWGHVTTARLRLTNWANPDQPDRYGRSSADGDSIGEPDHGDFVLSRMGRS